MMRDIEFAYPLLLLLLLVLIPLIVFHIYTWNRVPTLKVSSLHSVKAFRNTYKKWLSHFLFGTKILAVSLIITAIARPYTVHTQKVVEQKAEKRKAKREGIDIMLTIDISTSMLARDLQPDRLTAAKEAAIQFINNRTDDRIGVIIFAGESYPLSPVTTDHVSLVNFFNDIKLGILKDSTAIGDGLMSAVNHLRNSKAESKIIILLTDGRNNTGKHEPRDAGSLARQSGIRIYTIGVGTHGVAPYPMQDIFGNTRLVNMQVEIDEVLLKDLANATGGKYYRATDTKKLYDIYTEIDKLVKTEFEDEKEQRIEIEKREVEERYLPLVLLALIMLLGEAVIRILILRAVPY